MAGHESEPKGSSSVSLRAASTMSAGTGGGGRFEEGGLRPGEIVGEPLGDAKGSSSLLLPLFAAAAVAATEVGGVDGTTVAAAAAAREASGFLEACAAIGARGAGVESLNGSSSSKSASLFRAAAAAAAAVTDAGFAGFDVLSSCLLLSGVEDEAIGEEETGLVAGTEAAAEGEGLAGLSANGSSPPGERAATEAACFATCAFDFSGVELEDAVIEATGAAGSESRGDAKGSSSIVAAAAAAAAAAGAFF